MVNLIVQLKSNQKRNAQNFYCNNSTAAKQSE